MNSIIVYIKESYDELVNRVTWPDWKKLQKSSLITGIASIVIALLISAMDMLGKMTFSDIIYKLIN
ncbi:MAG: preprotein translocase subunit SecE [Chitinophagales bacterium]|nr:preprotein translocase subunit SecE [Chitinophagales bacterium]